MLSILYQKYKNWKKIKTYAILFGMFYENENGG